MTNELRNCRVKLYRSRETHKNKEVSCSARYMTFERKLHINPCMLYFISSEKKLLLLFVMKSSYKLVRESYLKQWVCSASDDNRVFNRPIRCFSGIHQSKPPYVHENKQKPMRHFGSGRLSAALLWPVVVIQAPAAPSPRDRLGLLCTPLFANTPLASFLHENTYSLIEQLSRHAQVILVVNMRQE